VAKSRLKSAQISTVITDLDNTLFDWFDFWYHAFEAMLDALVRSSGVPRETLVREIRQIHRRYGTPEYAFLIQELPSLRRLHPGGDLAEIYDEAIHAYRRVRKDHLKLYPGVLPTLDSLKEQGCLMVGYTDSLRFYSAERVRKLGLDGVLDFLYSPLDHELPASFLLSGPQRLAESGRLEKTVHRLLPRKERKPNPRVLLDIIRQVRADKASTIYVGNSLMHDIAMANEAHVKNVYAAYGNAVDPQEYLLLQQVSHWNDDDIEREEALRREHVRPTFTLHQTFSELLSLFEFTRFTPQRRVPSSKAVSMPA